MTIRTFDEARAAVTAGTSARVAALELVATMTDEQKLWCLDGDAPTWAGVDFLANQDGYHRVPFMAARVEEIGLPGIAFSDGPRGAVVGNATCFPVSMARGATWDPGLETRVGEAIGCELRALGATLTGAVCVNVLRHPAWGRAQETYGEDPHHVGEMGAAFTRGLQEHVMACMKHFACNSMENARFSVDIEVDEVALHEVFLPHFRRIAEAGVASVMSAYNSVNGEWCGQNRELLTRVLRDEWGFEGFVISDWIFGIRDAAESVAAGLDVEMPYRMVRAGHLPAALESGDVSWTAVDRAVEHIVATLLRFDAMLSRPAPSLDVVGSARHRALAREVAARSVVLLRNESVGGTPVLPLDDTAGPVAVIGTLADTVNTGDVGSSDVWDLECVTVLDGLRAAFGDVRYDDGTEAERAAAVARDADVAIVVVGTTSRDEGEYIGETDTSLIELFPPGDEPDVVDRFRASIAELPKTTKPPGRSVLHGGFGTGGDRTSLRLAESDAALIRAVAAANPRTVVAIQGGSAVIPTEWIDAVPAVVQAWYGGSQAGPGLGDVLLGTVNPSARLPFSIPVDEADLPAFDRDARTFRYDCWHGWWHLARHRTAPLFPFGFGLSYSAFSLSDVEVVGVGDAIDVRGTVRNDGTRDGADVVQVYAERPVADTPDRLVGFARVEVPARAAMAFHIAVPVTRLQWRDPATHSWQPPSGRHGITVARHAADPHGVRVNLDL